MGNLSMTPDFKELKRNQQIADGILYGMHSSLQCQFSYSSTTAQTVRLRIYPMCWEIVWKKEFKSNEFFCLDLM